MKSTVLRTSIWLANLILITQVISLIFILWSYSYFAYSLNDKFIVEFFDAGIKKYSETWMPKVKLGLLGIANLLGIYVFWLVRKLLIHIRDHGPFESSTVTLLDRFLRYLILYGAFKVLGGFLFDLIGGKLQISLNTSGLVVIFLIITVYILVDIFKYGRDMRQEQKLTI